MVKNVWAGDLALIELAGAGRTEAPREVLAQLKARGHVTITGGDPRLTPKGRARARKLAPAERELRAQFTANRDGPSLRTVGGGSSLHVGGGRASIRA